MSWECPKKISCKSESDHYTELLPEKLFVSIVFPTLVSIPAFQKFEMGLKKIRNFEKNIIGVKRS